MLGAIPAVATRDAFLGAGFNFAATKYDIRNL
jgi:hypothetical protein